MASQQTLVFVGVYKLKTACAIKDCYVPVACALVTTAARNGFELSADAHRIAITLSHTMA